MRKTIAFMPRASRLGEKLPLSAQSHNRNQSRRSQRERTGKVHRGPVGSNAMVCSAAGFQDVACDGRPLYILLAKETEVLELEEEKELDVPANTQKSNSSKSFPS
jgi:hypothetical protein